MLWLVWRFVSASESGTKCPEALEPFFSEPWSFRWLRWVDVGWMLAINHKHKGLTKTKKDPLVLRIPSLKLTVRPWKWMVGRWNFLLGWPNFRGYVSFREGKCRWDLLNHHGHHVRPLVVGKILSFWGPVTGTLVSCSVSFRKDGSPSTPISWRHRSCEFVGPPRFLQYTSRVVNINNTCQRTHTIYSKNCFFWCISVAYYYLPSILTALLIHVHIYIYTRIDWIYK